LSWAQERLYPALPVAGQNLACTLAGFARSRRRFTPHFHRTLRAWEASVRGPEEALLHLQRTRLDALVRRARAEVPFHRGLPPASEARDDRRAIQETLSAIPPLEKSTYREHVRELIARDIPRSRLIRGKTSGTTGTALPLWFTRRTLAEEFACFWRQRRGAGVGLRDPNLTFNGQLVVPFGERLPPFWRRNHWGRQTLFSLYHMTPENLPHYARAVQAAPATFVQGYPSSIHLVARALLESGLALPPGRLRGVFTSSESLLAFQRDTIERAFGAPVFDRYGVSEFCVSMTECRERRLHTDMEFCIVEVEVEEETEAWERGPLLVTGLATEATPFLRYRVGDVGTRSKVPCPCGRPGQVFLEVDGRLEDYVVTPDGRWVGRLDHVFKEQGDVAEAQVLQETPAALRVRVVRRPGYDEASERGLLKEFRMRLGDEIRIDLDYVETIPREPNGKLRAVKSAVGRPRAAGAHR